MKLTNKKIYFNELEDLPILNNLQEATKLQKQVDRLQSKISNLESNALSAVGLWMDDPCPCNSGKKYKQCCINKQNNDVIHHADTPDKCLMLTLTGEPYQPARLYYEIFDVSAVMHSLQKLKCIIYNPDMDKLEWVYDNESRRLKFNSTYSSIPKEKRPIVLGRFSLSKTGIYLDVRSFDRAVAAVEFFDEYIKRTSAKVKDIAIVNRFFDAKEEMYPNFDVFFNSKRVLVRDPEESIKKLNKLADKLGLAMAMKSINSNPFPEIERFPVHYYEDGINSLKGSLSIRTILAYEHWNGNTEMTMFDIIQRGIAKG